MSPRLQASMTPSQRESIVEFMQGPSYDAYTSQTGGILGILGNMEDNFNKDLRDGTADYELELMASEDRQAALKKTIEETEAMIKDLTEKKAAAEAASAEAAERNQKCTDSLET